MNMNSNIRGRISSTAGTRRPGFGRRLWRVITIFVGPVLAIVASAHAFGEGLDLVDLVAVAIAFTAASFAVSAGISYIFSGKLW